MSEGQALSDWLEDVEAIDDFDTREAEAAYDRAKKAPVGSTVACPGCGQPFEKKSYQHTFCCNRGRGNCKDYYWNRVDEQRLERAKRFA